MYKFGVLEIFGKKERKKGRMKEDGGRLFAVSISAWQVLMCIALIFLKVPLIVTRNSFKFTHIEIPTFKKHYNKCIYS